MTNQAEPIRRATLIIGIGEFGLSVMSRLLEAAAPRGVLHWDTTEVGDRRLRDLGLIWVNDNQSKADSSLEKQYQEITHKLAAGNYELMQDLYTQIKTVDHDDRFLLRDYMEEARKNLTNVIASDVYKTNGVGGLDVIVLARVERNDTLNNMTALLDEGMRYLVGDKTLMSAGSTGNPLNFISILDFEDFDGASNQKAEVRQSFYSWYRYIDSLRKRGQQTFSRLYLLNNLITGGSNVEAFRREDMTSLFIEFMLFENQRAGEFQKLYQLDPAEDSPISFFGIRLLERSPDLVKRLAAVNFASQWLDYLADQQAAKPEKLREVLNSFGEEQKGELLGEPEFKQAYLRAVQRVRERAEACDYDDDQFVEQVQKVFKDESQALQDELSALHLARSRQIEKDYLDELRDNLVGSITKDFHNDPSAASIGTVLTEVDEARAVLDATRAQHVDAEAPKVSDSLTRLRAVHSRYRRFAKEQVNYDTIKTWLLAFVICFTLILSPGLQSIFETMTVDQTSRLSGIVDFIQPNAVWLAPTVLLVGLWLLSRFAVRPLLNRRLRRKLAEFRHPKQGRLFTQIEKELDISQGLGAHLHDQFRSVVNDLERNVTSRASCELGHIRERLQARLSEARWLKKQLGAFQKVYGLGDKRQDAVSSQLRINQEVDGGFQRITGALAIEPSGFSYAMRELRLLKGWSEEYCDHFLQVFGFLDELAALYPEPFDALSDEDSREFVVDFVQHYGSKNKATVGFRYSHDVPCENHVVMPTTWGTPDVQRALKAQGILDAKVSLVQPLAELKSEQRMYLLSLATNQTITSLGGEENVR